MQRRTFLQHGLGASLTMALPLIAAEQNIAAANNDLPQKLQDAAQILTKAAADGQIHAASLYVRHKAAEFAKTFGAAKSPDDIFLLASITKPISVAAVMTLYDQGKFDLDDPVKNFIPEFTGDDRERITIRQLLTHVSGLPD